jgi:hypothetical protein
VQPPSAPLKILSPDEYMNILVAENENGEVSEEQFMILVELFD